MKSYVTLEQKMCPVCGKEWDTNSILMDTRLTYDPKTSRYKTRDTFDMHTTTGYDLCPEHDELWKKGYVAMVVCDPNKSNPTGSTLKIEDAYRTGEVIHIRQSVCDRLFNVKMSGPMAFIDIQAAEKIKQIVEESNKTYENKD